MSDLISRQAVLELIEHLDVDFANSFDPHTLNEMYRLVKDLTSVENTGEWKMPIQDDGMSDPIYYQVRCSKCGFDLDPQTWYEELHHHGADNYCPNCGARMKGGE